MSLKLIRNTTRGALLAIMLTGSTLMAQQPAGQKQLLPSNELNRHLPNWLRISGEYRARLEGFTGGGFKRDNDDLYFLSRFRLNLKIQPARWLRFVVQGQDAHVFGKNQHPYAPPFQDTMDLRLGYVELGDTEKRNLGFRIGRQELAFGEERLVGSANWLNTARSFDGIRASFHRKGYRLDAFASSVVNPRDGKIDRSTAGNNFYGFYGGLTDWVPKGTIEPYFFWRRAANIPTETKTACIMNFATVGFRWVGKLPANFDYGVEVAKQAGSLGTDSIGAWAGHWVLGYTVAGARFTPRVMAEYNYASGDANSGDGRRGTFNQLYATGHDKYGLGDQVGWQNIHHVRAGIEFKLKTRWLLSSRHNTWWLADPHDALYNAGGSVVARAVSGRAGRYVGQEIDFVTMFTLSGAMQVGGGYAHIFPGTFLKRATQGEAYNFPYVTCTVSF